MNKITINQKEIKFYEEEGIVFSNKIFIEIQIDELHFKEMNAFEGGAIYFHELKKSAKKTGEYLIFTCICGIADDAGWDKINVVHSKNEIYWEFERNGSQKFKFDRIEYIEQVIKCEKLLNLSKFYLAIENVVFPE
ncbi:MAG: hypothetical protein GY714_26965 [Desulfobacterales bacterium]|nr:hypothetical protein [Desulfobacterales bacterium]